MRVVKYSLRQKEYLPILIKESGSNWHLDSICSPDAVVAMLNGLYQFDSFAEEYVYMIALNAKGRVLGVFEVAHGQIDKCYLSNRELAVRALLCGASGIIVAHNHCSGVPTPSREDIALSESVASAMSLLGLRLHDFLIVGHNNAFYSFLQSGLLQK